VIPFPLEGGRAGWGCLRCGEATTAGNKAWEWFWLEDWSNTPLPQRDGCIPFPLEGGRGGWGCLKCGEAMTAGNRSNGFCGGFGLRVWEEKGGVQAKIGSGVMHH